MDYKRYFDLVKAKQATKKTFQNIFDMGRAKKAHQS